MSELVQPEYGPTLAEISGPRWPRVRLAIIVVLAVIAAFLLYRWVIKPAAERQTIVVRGPVAVNVLSSKAELTRETPVGTEELRLRGRGADRRQTFTITPLVLPPYGGTDPGGMLPLYAYRDIQRMSREIPGFQLRGEARTRINLYPGYSVLYTGGSAAKGDFFYGRRIYLYPDVPNPKTGVVLDLRTPRTAATQYPDAVGLADPLKLPLRSFNFGTERP